MLILILIHVCMHACMNFSNAPLLCLQSRPFRTNQHDNPRIHTEFLGPAIGPPPRSELLIRFGCISVSFGAASTGLVWAKSSAEISKYHWIFNITSIKKFWNNLICNPERQHYIKIFWGNFSCNGSAAFRNGILSRIIGQPRAWVVGSEFWKRSITRKVSDGVGVDGVGAKFPFLQVFAVFPVAEDWGTIDSNYLEMCRKH